LEQAKVLKYLYTVNYNIRLAQYHLTCSSILNNQEVNWSDKVSQRTASLGGGKNMFADRQFAGFHHSSKMQVLVCFKLYSVGVLDK
jgi:hypothetical protein